MDNSSILLDEGPANNQPAAVARTAKPSLNTALANIAQWSAGQQAEHAAWLKAHPKPAAKVYADNIPAELKAVPQWHVWKAERDGDRWVKRPYSAVTGKQCNDGKPESLCDFDTAYAYEKGEGEYGVGFRFTPDDPFTGIDLDGCRDKLTGDIEPWAQKLIDRFATYTEVSPSGTGVKMFVRGHVLKCGELVKFAPHVGIEVYDRGHYFCVTGDAMPGTPRTIADAQGALDELVAAYPKTTKPDQGENKPAKPSTPTPVAYSDDREKAISTLARLSPARADDYDQWKDVGMVLHAVDSSDAMLAQWEQWSQVSEKYKAGDCASKWKSFTPDGGLNLGSLIYWAQEDNMSNATTTNTNATASANANATAVCVRADTIKPRKITWLNLGNKLNHVIPCGKYSTLIGEPGKGKSLLTIAFASLVSRGPDGSAPGDVIMVQGEDDIDDTVVPRLMAAGADLSRIHFLTGISDPGPDGIRPFTLADMAAVERMLSTLPNPLLLTIDPVGSYCGKADANKDAEVRGLLIPLCSMAQRTGIASIGVTHFNKAAGSKAINRAMGSTAWVAVSRMAWGVVPDPDNAADRLLMAVKGNLAKDTKSYRFGITSVPVKLADGADDLPVIAWSAEEETRTIDEVIIAGLGHRSPKTTEAADWLRDVLAAGPVAQREVMDAAEVKGHGKYAITTAKKALGVQSYAEGFGRDCTWYWALPTEEQHVHA